MGVLDKVKGLFSRSKTMPQVPPTPPPPPPSPVEPEPEEVEADTVAPAEVVEPDAGDVVVDPTIGVGVAAPSVESATATQALTITTIRRVRPMDQERVEVLTQAMIAVSENKLREEIMAIDAKAQQALAKAPVAPVAPTVSTVGASSFVEQIGTHAVCFWTACGMGVLAEIVVEDGGAEIDFAVVQRS